MTAKDPSDMLDEDVTPMDPNAKAFTDALLHFLDCRDKLISAKKEVPLYTGHLSTSDLYAVEQEAYNRSGDQLYRLVANEQNSQSSQGA